MGSSIAEKLALDGHSVSYVTPLPSIATWTDNTLEQAAIIAKLNQLKVKLLPNTQLQNNATFVNVLTGENVEVPLTDLVFVGARVPVDALEAEIHTINPDLVVRKAGDCLTPGIIQAAVFSGHSVARSVLAGENVLWTQKRDQIQFT